MIENTNFMNFENLNKLIEEHRKETIPYKNYEFDNTSYTLLLININNLLKENQKSKDQQKEFIEYMKNEIYSIEPKGTGINYNCEYDSEEDYISAMKEQSKLNTLKEILSKYKEIIGGKDE